MTKHVAPLFRLLSVLLVGAAASAAAQSSRLPVVVIETTLGEIIVEIDSVHAPVSSANFLRYVDAGAYSGGRFHRTVRADNQPNDAVKIDVVQAGQNASYGRTQYAPIALERTSVTGLKHLDGTISMARAGPNTATSDFFICLGPQPALDFGGKRNADGQGFAAFGRVIKGIEVVKEVHASPAGGQSLTTPIAITRISRRR